MTVKKITDKASAAKLITVEFGSRCASVYCIIL